MNVILKGKKDRLAIVLNEEASIQELKESLREKLSAAKDFFSGGHIAIELLGKKLSQKEEFEILSVVEECGVNISVLLSSESFLYKDSYLKTNLVKEGLTKFYRGSLRSGSEIRSNGNLVVLGDVNPGARVMARGNIIVLGYLNGTAYAGENGNEDAFIIAFKMNPIQLKISETLTRNPNVDILSTNKIKKNSTLEIAHIKDGEIFVEKLERGIL